MSAETTTVAEAARGGRHDHAIPTDRLFVMVAVVLAVITAVEVAWSYLPWGDGTAMTVLEVGGLLLMMAVKFVVVAAIFMHLRFDSKVLTAIFYSGLFLALGVYVAVLFTFEFFG